MIGLLVVDDEEGVRRSLKRVLERDGYDIMLAEDGSKAIDIVREKGGIIETVISDYKMPGIDGLETLIEIGRINPEITRIMLTGYATMESAIESVNAGIDGFLTKPFENIELKAKVREYNIKKRLKQFVSESVYSQLQQMGQNITPVIKRVTILFCDIRGFTKMSERLSVDRMSDILNANYFSPLDNTICEYNGTLDKHIGDSIMGIFGAPFTYGDDVVKAVLCAIEMRDQMNRLSESITEESEKIALGFGIGTGDALAGIFGSFRKKEYTVFGHPVIVAARLERMAKQNQILICEETYRNVKDTVLIEKLGPMQLKGIEDAVNVYSVLGKKEKMS
ncbi:MAG: response regulator [Deltaproteobacteria bacterium]|nr:response regulator [Deltaproteobacteria bacterium]